AEQGLARNEITVVVAGHGGRLSEILPWLKLGVNVLPVESAKDEAEMLEFILLARMQTLLNQEAKTDEELEEMMLLYQFWNEKSHVFQPTSLAKVSEMGNIVVWCHPRGVYDEFGHWPLDAREFLIPLHPGGVLILQTDLRFYAEPFLAGGELSDTTELIFSTGARRDNYLLPSPHVTPDTTTIVIAKRK
ncbi:MAG: hypothetical protein Q7S68_06100, partial [Deltaproteobacteria bacterium]|nr:hypothetical protein [Deltaproteobacteria bacterium]